jgi:methylmalonyl-CoA carboxyltransferase large subunit
VLKPSAGFTSTKQSAEELAHETLVVIAAAVSAFLGKQVRLRSARLIQPSEGNAWAQQGRVFVQASHNLGLAHTHS